MFCIDGLYAKFLFLNLNPAFPQLPKIKTPDKVLSQEPTFMERFSHYLEKADNRMALVL